MIVTLKGKKIGKSSFAGKEKVYFSLTVLQKESMELVKVQCNDEQYNKISDKEEDVTLECNLRFTKTGGWLTLNRVPALGL